MYFGWQEAYRLSLRQLVHTIIITASTNDIQNTHGNALVKGPNGMIFEAPWIKNECISYVQEYIGSTTFRRAESIIDFYLKHINCGFIWLNAKILSMESYPRPIFYGRPGGKFSKYYYNVVRKNHQKGRKHQN